MLNVECFEEDGLLRLDEVSVRLREIGLGCVWKVNGIRWFFDVLLLDVGIGNLGKICIIGCILILGIREDGCDMFLCISIWFFFMGMIWWLKKLMFVCYV